MTTAHEASERPAQTLGEAFLATHALRVLLAEDNAYMLDLLEGILRQEGYQVTSVTDGNGLLAAIEQRGAYRAQPEFIISDVRMPGLSGVQVLERLRQTDQTTPVILITAFGDAEIHAQAERLGALVLDKPFLLDDLRAAVRDHRPNWQ